MKKNLVYAMMSAIALTSAVSFTGCASDDSASVDTNPTYDGKSVRTDFAFSVTKAAPGTRMTAATVQDGTSYDFLGINDMFLLPFDGEPGTGTVTETNSAIFHLGSLTTADVSAKVIDRETTTSSKVYSLTLPIGTDNFLFYGTSGASGTDFQKGVLTRSGFPASTATSYSAVGINSISFGLKSIHNSASLGEDATKIAAYLLSIANTSGWKATTATAKTDSRFQALSDLYKAFTSNASPRAGSAEAVARTVLDLYKSAKKINAQSSVSDVQTIANAICANINPSSGVKVEITETTTDPETWTAVMTGLSDAQADASFPANLLLPMGAAQLEWTISDDASSTASDKCEYKTTLTSFGGPSNTDVVNTISQYRYPAELIYFDNSPLISTRTYQIPDAYPKTAKNWDLAVGATNGFSSAWDKTEVEPETRAVAMRNNVNYGVALLQSRVKMNSSTTCVDNRASVLHSPATDQTNIDASKFVITGILIGGQPESVGWNMTSPNDDFDDIIYDNAVQYHVSGSNTIPLSTEFSSKNYTIVLDNYANKTTTTPGTDDDQKPVLIALQIKNGEISGTNKGMDFYGHDGLIPAGSTFYLVGTLNPTSVTSWSPNSDRTASASTYRITKESVKRVFIQDYKTVADITIDETTALKKAYSTIPDLRSTEILFGLSVDLNWETGLSFDVTIN